MVAKPENFNAPLVFYLEEELEQIIFGQEDRYLHCIEEHSHTLIQLEPWFTVTGHTRVTVVSCAPKCSDLSSSSQGYQMLQSVRSQPLTNKDMAASLNVQLDSLVVKGYQDE
ncbi:KH homology domain-containing protein 1-like [Dipodomys spectabilis]|uniref:KH homology domain-containing protein 1-like n=1 Tax=Dipodomys spectabilis TaxID=105255 RepID=UPI001C5409ED|nr:KH homology domain-containing protein 1-like [Dipodomys spectabilis]